MLMHLPSICLLYLAISTYHGATKRQLRLVIALGPYEGLEPFLYPSTRIARSRTRQGETWTIHVGYSLEQGFRMGTTDHRTSTGAQGRSFEWCHAIRRHLLRGNEGRSGPSFVSLEADKVVLQDRERRSQDVQA